MGYAVKGNKSWRMVGSAVECLPEESYSEIQPPPYKPSRIERISFLQDQYEIDRDKLNRAWLSAIIADGAEEIARKSVISAQMTALHDKLQADISSIIAEI
jgi:hypothetical protein